jgi:hypothetical protein
VTASEHFLTAFLALPLGTFAGTSGLRRYVVTRQVFAQGRSHKLVAHELGGNDYISLNLYQTRNSGGLLRPCEMSACKVTEFVTALEPDT